MRVKIQIIYLALLCLPLIIFMQSAAQTSSASLSTLSQGTYELVSDVFIGNGTVGPYVLSWKNFESGSETVTVDGRVLSATNEYNINCTTGAFTLSAPLSKEKIARVTYRRLIGKSEANSGVSLPLDFKLFGGDRANLNIIGKYNSGDGRNSQSGMSLYGLSGSMKFGQSSDISSTFITRRSSSADGKDSAFTDDSAMKFSAATVLGGFSFRGSFARAGEQFTAANEYGFQKAKQLADLSAAYGKESDVVFAAFSYKQQEDLGGDTKGVVQTDSEQKVVLNIANAPKMTISHKTSDKTAVDGTVASGTTLDTIQLDKGFGQKTTATAMLQKSEVAAGQSVNDTQITSLGVSSTAIDNLKLTGSVINKDSSQTGSEFGFDFTANAVLGRRMTMNAAYSSLDTDVAGMATKTSIGMTANPLSWMQFQSSLTLKDSDQAGSETGINVGFSAAPSARFSIKANHSDVNSDQNGQSSTTAIKVLTSPIDKVGVTADVALSDANENKQTAAGIAIAAKPIDQVKVEGSYSGKQVEQGDDEQQRTVKIEAQPAQFMKISAGVGEKETGVQLQNSKEAGVEISPNDQYKFASSIKELISGQSVTTVRNYSGLIKPTDYLELSGAYRDRQNPYAEDIDSKSFKMAVGPSRIFRLTGQYNCNPEDKDGNIQRLLNSAYGLELKIGIVGLTGAYAKNENYTGGDIQKSRELGLNFPLFGNGKLQTGYKLSEAASVLEQSVETISIGYTHDLGARFNLFISGELTRSDQDTFDPTEEYKATAKLGMKF